MISNEFQASLGYRVRPSGKREGLERVVRFLRQLKETEGRKNRGV